MAQKFSPERTYTPEEIRRNAFTIKLEQLPEEAYVSRCSLSVSKGKVTCDRYRVDRVEIDRFIGARKFYLFSAQFDFQLFKNLAFVENNGRSDVAFGKCELVSP